MKSLVHPSPLTIVRYWGSSLSYLFCFSCCVALFGESFVVLQLPFLLFFWGGKGKFIVLILLFWLDFVGFIFLVPERCTYFITADLSDFFFGHVSGKSLSSCQLTECLSDDTRLFSPACTYWMWEGIDELQLSRCRLQPEHLLRARRKTCQGDPYKPLWISEVKRH